MAVVFADWPAPKKVRAFYTTRTGGYSSAPFDTFNLAEHVGDDNKAVGLNRQRLENALASVSKTSVRGTGLRFGWLNQIHGTCAARCEEAVCEQISADASYTSLSDHVCVVMSADCLPVLFCDQSGTQVAAVHAGWRGLAQGILAKVLECFAAEPEQVLAYLGPAIAQPAFQVGGDVLQAFRSAQQSRRFSEDVNAAFLPDNDHLLPADEKKYCADLYRLARSELQGLGVTQVYGGDRCTLSEPEHFYSYRRTDVTGRMATGIWLESQRYS